MPATVTCGRVFCFVHKAFILIFALLSVSLLWAHDAEPINTEFATPLNRGAGNLQMGFQYFRGENDFDLAPFTLEYGFAPRMQFSITAPLTRSRQGDGTFVRPGNVGLGYRYLLGGGNERRFAVSLNPELTLPTGDKRVASRTVELGGFLNLDIHPAKAWYTHTNIGYETPVANFNEKEKNFVYRSAIMYELRENLRPVLEFLGEHDFHSHQTRAFVVPEMIFELHPRWELKTAIPVGATASTPNLGIQMQLLWKFGETGRQ